MAIDLEADPQKLPQILPLLRLRHLFFFIVAFLILFFVLFPKRILETKILHTNYPSAISILYLNTFIQTDPKKIAYRIALIQQELMLGHWFSARKNLEEIQTRFPTQAKDLETTLMALNFELYLKMTYQFKPQSRLRKNYSAYSIQLLQELLKKSQSNENLLNFAQAALGLNRPLLAFQIYQKLLKQTKDPTEPLLLEIAQSALMAKKYKLSGDLYFAAVDKTETLDKKQRAILLGLRAYQAGSFFDEGFKAIAKLPSNYLHNKQLLVFLTRFALAANKPALAEKYILRALAFPEAVK